MSPRLLEDLRSLPKELNAEVGGICYRHMTVEHLTKLAQGPSIMKKMREWLYWYLLLKGKIDNRNIEAALAGLSNLNGDPIPVPLTTRRPNAFACLLDRFYEAPRKDAQCTDSFRLMLSSMNDSFNPDEVFTREKFEAQVLDNNWTGELGPGDADELKTDLRDEMTIPDHLQMTVLFTTDLVIAAQAIGTTVDSSIDPPLQLRYMPPYDLCEFPDDEAIELLAKMREWYYWGVIEQNLRGAEKDKYVQMLLDAKLLEPISTPDIPEHLWPKIQPTITRNISSLKARLNNPKEIQLLAQMAVVRQEQEKDVQTKEEYDEKEEFFQDAFLAFQEAQLLAATPVRAASLANFGKTLHISPLQRQATVQRQTSKPVPQQTAAELQLERAGTFVLPQSSGRAAGAPMITPSLLRPGLYAAAGSNTHAKLSTRTPTVGAAGSNTHATLSARTPTVGAAGSNTHAPLSTRTPTVGAAGSNTHSQLSTRTPTVGAAASNSHAPLSTRTPTGAGAAAVNTHASISRRTPTGAAGSNTPAAGVPGTGGFGMRVPSTADEWVSPAERKARAKAQQQHEEEQKQQQQQNVPPVKQPSVVNGSSGWMSQAFARLAGVPEDDDTDVLMSSGIVSTASNAVHAAGSVEELEQLKADIEQLNLAAQSKEQLVTNSQEAQHASEVLLQQETLDKETALLQVEALTAELAQVKSTSERRKARVMKAEEEKAALELLNQQYGAYKAGADATIATWAADYKTLQEQKLASADSANQKATLEAQAATRVAEENERQAVKRAELAEGAKTNEDKLHATAIGLVRTSEASAKQRVLELESEAETAKELKKLVDATVVRQNGEITRLQADVAAKAKKLSDDWDGYAAADAKSKDDIAELNRLLTAKGGDVSRAAATIIRLNTTIDDKDAEIGTLTTTLDTRTREVAESKRIALDFNGKLTIANALVASLTLEKEGLQTDLDEAIKNAPADQAAAVARHANALKIAKDELATARSEHDAAIIELERVNGLELEAKDLTLRNLKASKRSELADKQQAIDSVQSALEAAETAKADADAELGRKVAELGRLNASIKSGTPREASLNIEVDLLKDEVRDLKIENSKLSKLQPAPLTGLGSPAALSSEVTRLQALAANYLQAKENAIKLAQEWETYAKKLQAGGSGAGSSAPSANMPGLLKS